MKKLLATLVCTASAALMHADSYNQNIIAIFGTGNPNAGWTTDSGSGITLGLRGKERVGGATTNVSGVYSFATGTVGTPGRAVWNYEFSINSGTAVLSNYDYFLAIDMDASQGIAYTYVNPFAAYPDNVFGDNSTTNGGGTKATVSTTAGLAGANFIAQNSQNIVFTGLNPFLNATYNYELFAVAKDAGVNGARLADVSITVVVGSGGAAVPDSGASVGLLGMGLLAVGLIRRKLV